MGSARIRKLHSILLVTLLQCALVSNVCLRIATAKVVPDQKVELQRSMARYRHLLRRNLQQAKEGQREMMNEDESKDQSKNFDQMENTQSHDKTADLEVLQHDDTELQNTEEAEKVSLAETEHSENQHVEETKVEEIIKEAEEKNVKQPGQQVEIAADDSSRKAEEISGEKQPVDSTEKEAEQVTGDQQVESSETGKRVTTGETVVGESEKGVEIENGSEEVKMVEESEQKTVEASGEQRGQGNNVEMPEPVAVIEKEKDPFIFPEPYLLTPTIRDWDDQRARWLESNPHMKLTSEGKPRVLIVTGSQPWPCKSPVGDNFHIKSFKLKVDYARIHKFEIYYNFVWMDPLFSGFWVKLPTLRNLMLTHPEVEWFMWVDSDAVFTDMMFEIPFHTFEGYNMVMWGMEEGLLKDRNWLLFNAGVFFLRNCQWSLDLIDKWSPMGPDGSVRDAYGKMLSSFLSSRGDNFPADDQSALAYLLLTDHAVQSKVKLVQDDYKISSWWIETVFRYEELMEKYHPGLGDWRWPFITHFTGCSPCNGNNNPDYSYEMCMDNFNRAFNFADNQVLAFLGFQHESLMSPNVFRVRNETAQPLELLGVNPWKDRIAQYDAQRAST